MSDAPILSVKNLRVDYMATAGKVSAVRDVSFDVHAGEVFGLAGESGSGKSTLAHAILRLLPPPAVISGGEVRILGRDVLAMNENELRQVRWRDAAIVFQSALNALNPVLTIGEQIVDCLLAHEPMGKAAAMARAAELLQWVDIDPKRLGAYPHELSGGMRQRVVIAIALALKPRLLIMDEPTTALDVVVQREILLRLTQLRQQLDFAILFITHDLSLMLELTHRMAVLYAGEIAELGPTQEMLQAPRHPYTKALMDSFPSIVGPKRRLAGLSGSPPNLRALPEGCAFHPRCGSVIPKCSLDKPRVQWASPAHGSACHLEAR